MTPERLEALAAVMGWEAQKCGEWDSGSVFDVWVDSEGNRACNYREFHPDTDLNLALPLLQKYNEGKGVENVIELRSALTRDDMWLITYEPLTRNKITTEATTAELAGKLTETIYERLDSKPKV